MEHHRWLMIELGFEHRYCLPSKRKVVALTKRKKIVEPATSIFILSVNVGEKLSINVA
jgi:hypothetical protein